MPKSFKYYGMHFYIPTFNARSIFANCAKVRGSILEMPPPHLGALPYLSKLLVLILS